MVRRLHTLCRFFKNCRTSDPKSAARMALLSWWLCPRESSPSRALSGSKSEWTRVIGSLLFLHLIDTNFTFIRLCRSFAWIVPGVLLGGEKKKSEKARVRKGINVLISTPGRLIDHITHTKCLSLAKIKFLVLDEGTYLCACMSQYFLYYLGRVFCWQVNEVLLIFAITNITESKFF